MQPQSELNEMLITSIQNVHEAIKQFRTILATLDQTNQVLDQRITGLNERLEKLEQV